jgi:hypothetical protein
MLDDQVSVDKLFKRRAAITDAAAFYPTGELRVPGIYYIQGRFWPVSDRQATVRNLSFSSLHIALVAVAQYGWFSKAFSRDQRLLTHARIIESRADELFAKLPPGYIVLPRRTYYISLNRKQGNLSWPMSLTDALTKNSKLGKNGCAPIGGTLLEQCIVVRDTNDATGCPWGIGATAYPMRERHDEQEQLHVRDLKARDIMYTEFPHV